MNTFNMKQWLTSKNVGPYQKLHENIGGYVDMKPASMEEDLETPPFGQFDANPSTSGTQLSGEDEAVLNNLLDALMAKADEMLSRGESAANVVNFLKNEINSL